MADKFLNVVKHVIDFWMPAQVAGHGLVFSRKLAQTRLIVRIGQHADIKNIVSIQRNAALEGKRLKNQCQLRDGL